MWEEGVVSSFYVEKFNPHEVHEYFDVRLWGVLVDLHRDGDFLDNCACFLRVPDLLDHFEDEGLAVQGESFEGE